MCLRVLYTASHNGFRTEILNSKSSEQNVSTLFEPKFFWHELLDSSGGYDGGVELIMFENSGGIKIIKCVCVTARARKSYITATSYLEYLLLAFIYNICLYVNCVYICMYYIHTDIILLCFFFRRTHHKIS